MTKIEKNISSSFRDPSGFVYQQDKIIYRQVNISYKEDYDRLLNSGLYNELIKNRLLIEHEEVDSKSIESKEIYKIIKPKPVSFISYPYEWCFSQLKDAALLTLKIQKTAMNFDMTLKDCSNYNIQFMEGKPVLIDTLSFEKYYEGKPWTAYRQFCQHFFAPLLLMARCDVRLGQLLKIFLDGVPLDLTSSLLSIRTYLEFSIFSHIHCHSGFQRHYAYKAPSERCAKGKVNRLSLLALIDNLESKIRSLKWSPKGTEWISYYANNNYKTETFEYKKKLVAEYVEKLRPKIVWDIGANTGLFSRVVSRKGIQTISFDIDPACVEKNYNEVVRNKEKNILPLVLDLTNPSPAIGWNLEERVSILDRGTADTILALALIHHLAISNNLPMNKIARFFGDNCNTLIIEFIPKEDSQIQRLLRTRKDIFGEYTQKHFEEEFKFFFNIRQAHRVKDSFRTLYLMEAK